ncbi:MAG TPA: glycosyltransferase family 2 protein [Saprospiraceae bacterium]|nr:glycosyltransferase family 2 protein [Saprospiraceae bacterium]
MHQSARARFTFTLSNSSGVLEIVFWLGLAIIVYAYLGYGFVLWLLVRLKRWFFRRPPLSSQALPEVTFIVCAFNEADWMARKIENSLSLDYPRQLIHFWFVTDGSDDQTPQIVAQYPYPADVQWQLLHQPERRGKIAAFQRAMELVKTPVVVSTDANTFVNREAIQRLVSHFSQQDVGAVAGEKRISMSEKEDASSAGEGIYWRYESLLKKWDAELWTVVGAAGELFALRTDCYEPVPPDTLVEDFYMTMRIAQRGYKVAYAPDAWASERSSASVGEEMKRKVRIAAGGLQAIVRLAPLLNPFRYGVLSFQYISHRVLRWTLAPLFLPVLLAINTILAFQGKPLYQWLLAGQVSFYLAALLGWFLEQHKLKIKVLFVPYYFCLMNWAMYAGLARLLRGKQSVIWEKAKRAEF